MTQDQIENQISVMLSPIKEELDAVKNQLKQVQQINQQLRSRVSALEKSQQHLHQSMY